MAESPPAGSLTKFWVRLPAAGRVDQRRASESNRVCACVPVIEQLTLNECRLNYSKHIQLLPGGSFCMRDGTSRLKAHPLLIRISSYAVPSPSLVTVLLCFKAAESQRRRRRRDGESCEERRGEQNQRLGEVSLQQPKQLNV